MQKTYIGTKIIRALPMARQEYNDYRGWELPANEDGADEGYLVEYLDGGRANDSRHAGYISWSPKDVFERAYRASDAMTFGQALEALKAGKQVARAGWNGKGQFVYLVPAASYPVQTGAAKAIFGDAALVPYRPYLALKTAQGDVATWAPSCSDALAEDWAVVD
jgi:hypothetical protein